MTDHPPAWHPDPTGRYDHRWWDGTQWTDQVSSEGQATTDPEGVGETVVPTSLRGDDKVASQIQGQVAKAGGSGAGWGSDDLLDADILVVNQKAKFIELSNEYMVYDEHGTQVGAVRQVGQSGLRKVARLLGGFDQFLTHRLEIVDLSGKTRLRVTRPAKFFKSKVIVESAAGQELGRIIQQNMIGKIRFDLQVNGQSIGALRAENWRAWDFHIHDESGEEVARIKKTFEGLARALFTTADNYVLRVHRKLDDPLRQLVIAAALSVDIALKQDDN